MARALHVRLWRGRAADDSTNERRDVGGSMSKPSGGRVTPAGWARRGLLAAGAVATLGLAGCSAETVDQLKRLGLPVAASDRAPYIFDLWIGTWIAAGIIGVIMWVLILWAALRYKSNHNKTPRQNRYNLPMEIFFTVTPVIIVGVLFYFTVVAQNNVLKRDPNPDMTVDVVGQKWSWTFNYKSAENPAVGTDVWEAGTVNETPDLYLVAGKSVQFNLSSPDVIHSFWVPAFYQKLDVVPGRHNSFQMTPTTEGVYAGKCAELCGTYHSAMLFNVHVVGQQEYDAHLKSLAAKGQTGEAKGPADANANAKAAPVGSVGSEEGTE